MPYRQKSTKAFNATEYFIIAMNNRQLGLGKKINFFQQYERQDRNIRAKTITFHFVLNKNVYTAEKRWPCRCEICVRLALYNLQIVNDKHAGYFDVTVCVFIFQFFFSLALFSFIRTLVTGVFVLGRAREKDESGFWRQNATDQLVKILPRIVPTCTRSVLSTCTFRKLRDFSTILKYRVEKLSHSDDETTICFRGFVRKFHFFIHGQYELIMRRLIIK